MLDINIYRTVLIRILKDLYSDLDIGPFLGFKGGTAAYLFYNLDRFSVDLDFDLVDVDNQDLVFEKVKNILKEYGELRDARKKRYTFFSCFLMMKKYLTLIILKLKLILEILDLSMK